MNLGYVLFVSNRVTIFTANLFRSCKIKIRRMLKLKHDFSVDGYNFRFPERGNQDGGSIN